MAVEGDESAAPSPELKYVTCSLVMIREKKSEWNVFPPSNHENLQVLSGISKEEEDEEERNNSYSSFTPPSSDSLSSPSRSSITSFSSSSFPPLEDGDEASIGATEESDSKIKVREAGYVSGWWRIWFGILRSKMLGIIGWPLGCRNTAMTVTFPPYFPTSMKVLGLLYWLIRLQRWWSRRNRDEERLTRLIKEKDQKIAHLLNQIAQMNDLLIQRNTELRQ
ncbi:hypothetical protein SAY86_010254 [Trapa natans]|uniref:Uncharacterized protein n=1 Tax=Trapa natans TaxID=22666 RepID=A0AAN7L100_TRANT|nr:hypothetical protein SAY86_010254 [Trapa natans]